MRHPDLFRPAPAAAIYSAMKTKSDLERLTEAARQAEAELCATTTFSALNAAGSEAPAVSPASTLLARVAA
jgi:hypothetical protein